MTCLIWSRKAKKKLVTKTAESVTQNSLCHHHILVQDMSPTYMQLECKTIMLDSYIDVGDGCWRHILYLICWWLILKITVDIMILPPTCENCHHYRVTKITCELLEIGNSGICSSDTCVTNGLSEFPKTVIKNFWDFQSDYRMKFLHRQVSFFIGVVISVPGFLSPKLKTTNYYFIMI